MFINSLSKCSSFFCQILHFTFCPYVEVHNIIYLTCEISGDIVAEVFGTSVSLCVIHCILCIVHTHLSEHYGRIGSTLKDSKITLLRVGFWCHISNGNEQ